MANWLEEPQSKAELEELMKVSWEKTSSAEGEEGVERILEGIHKKIEKSPAGQNKQTRIQPIWGRFVKVAASLSLLGLLAIVGYRMGKRDVVEEKIEAPITYTKEAKRGEKLKLRLPDQTFVILNANSSISYRSDFGRTERRVALDGEAFFEITPDKERPFKVTTGEIATTALGTAFNASSRHEKVEISLTEGKVKVEHLKDKAVQPVVLSPGQMAAVAPSEDGDIAVMAFDPIKVTEWKEGRIRFKSKTLKEVVEDLETWYGMDIQLDRRINARRKVSGVFDNESLENILKGLTFSLGFQYEIHENNVTIKKQ
ncbi:FecR family protein [Echinicola sediminis]